jgi:hypothetical protein
MQAFALHLHGTVKLGGGSDDAMRPHYGRSVCGGHKPCLDAEVEMFSLSSSH